MSDDTLVEMALQRQEVFNNLSKYLEIIKKITCNLDPNAEAYLFGSATTEEHNYSSDIDILIITKLAPAKINSELWKAGIREPFEIHVYSPEKATFFKSRAKLTQL